MVEDRESIGHCQVLRIRGGLSRDVGRWISTSVVRDASAAPGKPADLGFPAAMVSSELVDEQDRFPCPNVLEIEVDSIVGGRKTLLSPTPGTLIIR
jgi:hypothetical protein